MKILSSFAAVFLLSLLVQAASAQDPPSVESTTVVGSSNNCSSANDAVNVAETDYYAQAAILIATHILYPHAWTDVPETTVYPNSDGTFNAVATGQVHFWTWPPIEIDD